MLLIGTSLYFCTPLQIARPHAASTMQNRLYDALLSCCSTINTGRMLRKLIGFLLFMPHPHGL